MKIENRQQFLIVLTAIAGILLIGDRVVLTRLTNLWKDRSSEITRLRTQVTEGSALLKREQAIRDNWAGKQTNSLPNNPSLAQEQVLKAFVNWAQESGVSINAITPQWKNDSDDFKTLVCHVDASGTMWTLSRFLYDVELGPMALKVESLDLSSHDNNGQQLSLGLQVSGLVLSKNR